MLETLTSDLHVFFACLVTAESTEIAGLGKTSFSSESSVACVDERRSESGSLKVRKVVGLSPSMLGVVRSRGMGLKDRLVQLIDFGSF